MAELIHTHSARVSAPGGGQYEVRVYAESERGGPWEGWLEFHEISTGSSGPAPRVLRTGRETTQTNREAIDYWAGGLEPVYLEGAFDRARPID